MTPEKIMELWGEEYKRQAAAEARLDRLRERATLPALRLLRAMTSDDVEEGRVVYHCHHDEATDPRKDPDGWFWHAIAEVRYPDDDFKAYIADDGCRYGLRNAYVRK